MAAAVESLRANPMPQPDTAGTMVTLLSPDFTEHALTAGVAVQHRPEEDGATFGSLTRGVGVLNLGSINREFDDITVVAFDLGKFTTVYAMRQSEYTKDHGVIVDSEPGTDIVLVGVPTQNRRP